MGRYSGEESLPFSFFLPCQWRSTFNPIALRKAKIVCNFGLSECNNRVKGKNEPLDKVMVSYKPHLEDFVVQDSKQEVTKVISLSTKWRKIHGSVPTPQKQQASIIVLQTPMFEKGCTWAVCCEHAQLIGLHIPDSIFRCSPAISFCHFDNGRQLLGPFAFFYALQNPYEAGLIFK